MSSAKDPDATVVIVTRDRRQEVERAIRSALTQTAATAVLVVDDGSRDGTAAMIAKEFPEVHLECFSESKGIVVQRNCAARIARGPIIVSIDDDAYFPSSETVAQTLGDFADPRIGAVAIPYIDHDEETVHRQFPPDPQRIWVAARFTGTAHAVRRDVFLRLGGYRHGLFQQGEEADFCLRMLADGFVTRLGRADPIVHRASSHRDELRHYRYNRRNDVLYAWHNVPMPYFPVRLAKVFARSVVLGRTPGAATAVLRGTLLGFREALLHPDERRPVARSTYRLAHRIKARGPLLLSEIEAALPPLSHATRPESDGRQARA